MGRSKSSRRWLSEHFSDEYVALAQQQGYRSRAVFKLKELQDKYHFIQPRMTIVDLGSAPGGWSQMAVELLGQEGKVIASDILPMEPIDGVAFIEGDFREQAVYEALLSAIGENKADLVLSDMAPNMSGMDAVDQPRAMYLVELALDMAEKVLKPGGGMVVKLFQGEGSEEYLRNVRQLFKQVMIKKPKASRPRSREVYVLALNKR